MRPSQESVEVAPRSMVRGKLPLQMVVFVSRMERVLQVFESFEEAEEADLEQWLALSGRERVMAGEALRETAFPNAEPGFQKVLEVVERPRR